MPTSVEAAPAASANGTVGTSEAAIVLDAAVPASAPAAQAPLTLADRLARTADARHGAIGATRNRRNVRAYNSSDWFPLLFSVRNRGLFHLWQPMLLVTICACGFTPVAVLYAHEATCETLDKKNSGFSLVLTALAFLLVFRLNRSATRHYEARRVRARVSSRSLSRALQLVRGRGRVRAKARARARV